MTDLRHVWVLGANVELIRADQVISVFVKRSDHSDPWPLTLHQLQELDDAVSVSAEVLGGGEGTSRQATLLTCHVTQAPSAAAGLTKTLAKWADKPLPALYVYPHLHAVEGRPTIGWRVDEAPPEAWPNIYGELLELAKTQRRRR